MERLTPWVFEHAQIADSDCTDTWPDEKGDFKYFFYCLLDSYYAALGLDGADEQGFPQLLNANETIVLPKKNWRAANREYHTNFMRSQGMMVRGLVETVYRILKDTIQHAPRVYFPVANFDQKYVIGGQRYASRPDGAAMVGIQEQRFPIISFAGWYEGQTWSEFLSEILSIMLGQLAKNVAINPQDQEVFVIGFYERGIYFARGYFPTDLISRVHRNGCTEDEAFEIQFTRSYNLSLKNDWVEAMEALTGLLRYLLGGDAKVGVLQNYFHGSCN